MELNQTGLEATVEASSSLATPQTGVVLAALAYSTQLATDLQTYLPGWTLGWQGNVTKDGNTAFVAVDPSGEYYGLGFRGSLPPFDVFKTWDAFANWVLEDMDVITEADWTYVQPTTTGAKISSGANRAFSNVLSMTDQLSATGPGLVDYLNTNAVNNQKNVIIAGHSLGGNIANVFASFFATQAGAAYTGTSLFTYAAPAPGNSAFAQDLDSKISNAWHYENANDIVPKFPVFASVMVGALLLYSPSPYSGAITTSYDGHTVSLREGILLLAGALYLYGYTQQALNYKVFPNPLDTSYESNTMDDYFQQAGAQHALPNYATYLGVTLDDTLAALSSPVKKPQAV